MDMQAPARKRLEQRRRPPSRAVGSGSGDRRDDVVLDRTAGGEVLEEMEETGGTSINGHRPLILRVHGETFSALVSVTAHNLGADGAAAAAI